MDDSLQEQIASLELLLSTYKRWIESPVDEDGDCYQGLGIPRAQLKEDYQLFRQQYLDLIHKRLSNYSINTDLLYLS